MTASEFSASNRIQRQGTGVSGSVQSSGTAISGRDSEQHSFLRGSGLCGAAVSAARFAGETSPPQRLFLLLNDPEVTMPSLHLIAASEH